MWLIVGLGNPGPQYSGTRHNIGFLSLDHWARKLDSAPWNTEHKAFTLKSKIPTQSAPQPILLVKPQTYMNLSGESVQSLLNFYKIPISNLLVVQDDIDQPFGKMRFHKNRGHGGHNGIRNISQLLGTADYVRLKLGVGRPPHPEMNVADYVLQKFSAEETLGLDIFLGRSTNAIESLIKEGLNKASSQFNE